MSDMNLTSIRTTGRPIAPPPSKPHLLLHPMNWLGPALISSSFHLLSQPLTKITNRYGYGHLTVYNASHLYWEQIFDFQEEPIDSLWLIQEQHGGYQCHTTPAPPPPPVTKKSHSSASAPVPTPSPTPVVVN